MEIFQDSEEHSDKNIPNLENSSMADRLEEVSIYPNAKEKETRKNV